METFVQNFSRVKKLEVTGPSNRDQTVYKKKTKKEKEKEDTSATNDPLDPLELLFIYMIVVVSNINSFLCTLSPAGVQGNV